MQTEKMTHTDSDYAAYHGRLLAKRTLKGMNRNLSWRDAGYSSATHAAYVLVDGSADIEVRRVAIQIVADAIGQAMIG